MKNPILNLLLISGLVLGVLAFTLVREGGIRGRISPAETVAQVLAITGTDTLRTDVASGRFSFANIKKGTYTLWIKTTLPYKDTTVEQVAVIDSAVTDVGEIKLQQ